MVYSFRAELSAGELICPRCIGITAERRYFGIPIGTDYWVILAGDDQVDDGSSGPTFLGSLRVVRSPGDRARSSWRLLCLTCGRPPGSPLGAPIFLPAAEKWTSRSGRHERRLVDRAPNPVRLVSEEDLAREAILPPQPSTAFRALCGAVRFFEAAGGVVFSLFFAFRFCSVVLPLFVVLGKRKKKKKAALKRRRIFLEIASFPLPDSSRVFCYQIVFWSSTFGLYYILLVMISSLARCACLQPENRSAAVATSDSSAAASASTISHIRRFGRQDDRGESCSARRLILVSWLLIFFRIFLFKTKLNFAASGIC